jgi:hypothetical protein
MLIARCCKTPDRNIERIRVVLDNLYVLEQALRGGRGFARRLLFVASKPAMGPRIQLRRWS